MYSDSVICSPSYTFYIHIYIYIYIYIYKQHKSASKNNLDSNVLMFCVNQAFYFLIGASTPKG